MKNEHYQQAFYTDAYYNPWDFVIDNYDIKSRSRRLWVKDEIYAELVKKHFVGEGGNCNTILDVGCGAGTLSILLADWFRVYSLDFSRAMLERLKLRVKELKIDGSTLIQADNQRIPFKDSAFDGSFCKFALWPVSNPEWTIEEMVRVTKQYGRIVILEVDRRTEEYKSNLRTKVVYSSYKALKRVIRIHKQKNKTVHDDAAWKLIRDTTKNNPRINLEFIRALLEDNGCEIISVDTTIKEEIDGFMGKLCGGQCGGHNYFMICAKKGITE
jgi:ubiquinone/menaquinone biosynthesis C-methylase UbiE